MEKEKKPSSSLYCAVTAVVITIGFSCLVVAMVTPAWLIIRSKDDLQSKEKWTLSLGIWFHRYCVDTVCINIPTDLSDSTLSLSNETQGPFSIFKAKVSKSSLRLKTESVSSLVLCLIAGVIIALSYRAPSWKATCLSSVLLLLSVTVTCLLLGHMVLTNRIMCSQHEKTLETRVSHSSIVGTVGAVLVLVATVTTGIISFVLKRTEDDESMNKLPNALYGRKITLPMDIIQIPAINLDSLKNEHIKTPGELNSKY